MKRILIVAAAALIVLVLAAALALPWIVDVEKHRPTIEQALSSATGRAVTLGPLRLRVLPLPTLAAAGLTIGEDPKFGKEPFLQASRLEVRVSLLPLLLGRVSVASLTIDSPKLNLRRSTESRWNLAGLIAGGASTSGGAGAAGAAPAAGTAEGGSGGSSGGGAVSLSVARLRLADGSVTFVDEGLVKRRTLATSARGIDLTVTDLSATSPVGVDLSFELEGAGQVRLRGRVGPPPPDPAAGGWPIDARLQLSGFKAGPAAAYLEAFTGIRIHGGSLDLDVEVEGEAPGDLKGRGEATLRALEVQPLLGSGKVVLDAAVDLDGIFSRKETRLAKCDVTVGGSTVSVTGSLTGLEGDPSLDARVVTRKVALKDVAPVLRLVGPFMPQGLALAGEIALDASAKGPLADPLKMSIQGRATISGLQYSDASLREPITGIGGTLSLEGDRAEISDFTASLGRSQVRGGLVMTRFERPILDVRLAAPLIDVDELLTFLPAGGARASSVGDVGAGVVRARREGGGAADVVPARRESPAAAASLLRDVTVRGDLSVEQARVMNLRLSGAKASLSMERGQAALRDVSLGLYGGSMTGRVSAGLAEPGPPFSLSAALQGVDFNAMATDLSPDLRGLIYGRLEATLDLDGRGLAQADLRRHLAGRGSLALRDGKLTSFGILKSVAKALQAAGGRGLGEDETPFTSLTGTFDVANGKARTEDLKLDSPDIDMKGKGSVQLDLALALDIAARISQPVSADMVARTPNLRHLLDGKERLALDVKVGGTLVEPSVGIDPAMLRRAAKSAAKEEIREKGKGVLQKLLDKKKE